MDQSKAKKLRTALLLLPIVIIVELLKFYLLNGNCVTAKRHSGYEALPSSYQEKLIPTVTCRSAWFRISGAI